MPLHADRQEWLNIFNLKKKLIGPLVDKFFEKYSNIAEERREEGWRRTTTSEIEEKLRESRDWSDDCSFNKLIDIFLVIYDSDDAYANVFHRFVDKCNKGELDLEYGEMYLKDIDRGSEEWLDKEYEEQLNMRQEEIQNLMKKMGIDLNKKDT